MDIASPAHSARHSARNHHAKMRVWLGVAVLFCAVVWFAGGASRADQLGQVAVRSIAWLVCLAAIFTLSREGFAASVRSARSLWGFAGLLCGIAALQLLPLAPSLWTGLPGREVLAKTAEVAGFEQVWRPFSVSPSGTVNALSALIVPFAALLLFTQAAFHNNRRLLTGMLISVMLCVLLGLLQFTGARFDNPFINDGPGDVAGVFANRNHFALFASFGCVLAPVWGFSQDKGARWRGPLGIGLMLCCALLILASGSRSGLALGGIGMVLGLLAVGKPLVAQLRRLPRGLAIGLVLLTVAGIVGFLVLSFLMGRAVSIDRAMDLASADDLRARALPTVWAMVQLYFPFGTGLGTFDPVYRINEPLDLLQPAYLNHAHNDWLEVVLELGLAGVIVLALAAAWWAYKSFAAWRSNRSSSLVAKAGSALILLTMLASLTDYPARTPLVMVALVVAAIWLNRASSSASRNCSPSAGLGR